jgi:RNA polymerase sigma factor (sigma-70 family)
VAVAYTVLGDHQLAEDAAQEAFARGLMNLRKLKDGGRFAPWLAQICRNVAIDMARARHRAANAERTAEVAGSHQNDETVELVRAAIDRLPASMKEVVILRYYNHCSYEQISTVLGLSKMTINGRLTRAKRRLTKYLRCQRVLENMT